MSGDGGRTGGGVGLRRLAQRRRAALLWLLIVLVAAAPLAALADAARSGRLHAAPLAVVAPPVVGGALAAAVDDLDGRPFETTAVADADDAITDVRRGRFVAAYVLELPGTRDRLVLHADRHEQLDEALLEQVGEVASARGRQVEVERVAGGAGASAGQAGGLTVVASLLGYAVVVAIALVRGPVARSLGLGAVRVLGLLAAGAVTGFGLATLAGVPGADWRTGLILTAGFTVAALATHALTAVGGLAGIAIAAALFLALEAPLLLATDPVLLPQPWRSVTAWTPVGAAAEAVDANLLYDGGGLGRGLAVMVTWSSVAVLAALVARHGRDVDPRAVVTSGSEALVRTWRIRVLGTVVPVAVSLLLAVAVLPRNVVASPAATVSPATESRCLATGAIDDVGDLNRVAGRLRGSPDFRGGDVGASALLQDGRRVMVFGDTLRRVGGERRFVRNSMLVFEEGCLRAIRPADEGALIPARSRGDAAVGYWPMGVQTVEREGYDLLVVTAQRVRATGDGAFDFENLGPAVAVFVVPRGGTPQLIGISDVGEDSADTTLPAWGAATAVDDGWLLLYGTARPDQPGVFGFALHVARVRPDDLLDLTAWEYWDGADWVDEPVAPATLVPAVGGVSQTLSVFEQDGTWYALSKRDEFLGDEIAVWSAPEPWGPYDAGREVISLPSDAVTGELRYMPLAHPDLFPVPGTVVVSYSRNRTDVGEVLEDPLLYRPRFIRVTLP